MCPIFSGQLFLLYQHLLVSPGIGSTLPSVHLDDVDLATSSYDVATPPDVTANGSMATPCHSSTPYPTATQTSPTSPPSDNQPTTDAPMTPPSPTETTVTPVYRSRVMTEHLMELGRRYMTNNANITQARVR